MILNFLAKKTVGHSSGVFAYWFLLVLLIEALAAQVYTGPCTRRTSVVLSEIHYHPAGDFAASREFIELYNSSPISVDLSGWKLRGSADYEIPFGTRLEGGRFLVIAADPDASIWAGFEATILGPWTGTLPNNAGTVRLRKASGGIVLETNYRDDRQWPLAADGAGHSLVLAQPSFGESRPEAWQASREFGGSPGREEPMAEGGIYQIKLSEVLSASSPMEDDFIELYNGGSAQVDLSGCFLGKDRSQPGFEIPVGTQLGAGDYLSFSASTLGFVLDETGDEIFFRAPDGLRVIDSRKIGPQALNHSWGGLNDWVERQTPTPGSENSEAHRRNLVINEIHYHPVGGDNAGEFVEILNLSDSVVDLSGWKIRDGIRYDFPNGTSISAGGYLVIAKDRMFLLERYSSLDPNLIVGDFEGSLSNREDRLELRNAQDHIVDEVRYYDGGRWPSAADGGGRSLQLLDPEADNAVAASWGTGLQEPNSDAVVVEKTGVLAMGHQRVPMADRLHLMLTDEGEAVIDNIEVIVDGENLLLNGDFSDGASGWNFFGTHRPSRVQGDALTLIARDSGGDLANLIESELSSPISPGQTVTIRATCRWISGSPDILLGLNGGWFEVAKRLPVPSDSGTPGEENEGLGNVGPAITEVSHSPLLPQAGEPITVSARVSDPDGIASMRLRYRLDPRSSLQQVTMIHQGEGIFTGEIPPQDSGTMIAFHLLGIDGASPSQISRFPKDAQTRECLIRIGEETPDGDLSTMRIWVTRDTFSEWRDRERSSNLKLDATFVSDGRVFYNAAVHYAGSQNGVRIYDSPVGNPTGYNIELPKDQFFLNVQNLTLDRETTRDATRQRERLLYWFLEKLKLPNLHRRYVHVFFNGVERDQVIMEDVQKPNRDVMEQWFRDKGRLTKTNPWFEFDADGEVIRFGSGDAIPNRLQHFKDAEGELKLPRYRWTWSHGAGHDSGHDFSGLSELIDAAESPDEVLLERMSRKADLRQWMRTFAMNDLGSFWDTFGNPGSKNAYLFESLSSNQWSVVVWDMDVGLGVLNDPFNAELFPANVDENIKRLYDQPAVIREYWQAIDESLKTFFKATPGSEVRQILEETYEVLLENSEGVVSPFVPSGPDGLSVDDWISHRRMFLESQLAGKDAEFSVTGPTVSDSQLVTISGTIPLASVSLTVNEVPLDLNFVTITNWTAEVPLQPGLNSLQIESTDRSGTVLGSKIIEVEYTGGDLWAELRINEWMASNPSSSGILDPADGKADDWIELYNPTAEAVSLDGWYLSDNLQNPLKYKIPDGFQIPANGYLLVWADDEIGQNDPLIRQELHAGFKLSAEGDSITLTAPDAMIIDRVEFGEQTSEIVRLRLPDGSETLGYSTSATPAMSNGFPIPVTAVEVSTRREGSAFVLNFSSESGTIYEVERSDDLKNWAAAGSPFVGDGTPVSVSFDFQSEQYFRVRAF